MTARRCAWCRGEIPGHLRRDAVCCSVRCRQARHRFNSGVGTSPQGQASTPLRLAYADPPYPGLSRRYYGDHHDFAGEVDHEALIASLAEYDGWALSTSARALQDVLALCPPGSRVAAWHRGERPTRSAGPLNAWEPVIYFGGRRVVQDVRRDASAQLDATHPTPALHDASQGPGRRVDSLVYAAKARTTDPNRVIGAKPAAFCRWVFDLLGAHPGDDFTDIYPGSGGVLRAWSVFTGTEAA